MSPNESRAGRQISASGAGKQAKELRDLRRRVKELERQLARDERRRVSELVRESSSSPRTIIAHQVQDPAVLLRILPHERPAGPALLSLTLRVAGEQDTRRAADVMLALDRMYLSAARCYGLGLARPFVQLRTGSLFVELLAYKGEVAAGLSALWLYLNRGQLPEVLALPERVKASKREYQLRVARLDLERERVERQRELLRAQGELEVQISEEPSTDLPQQGEQAQVPSQHLVASVEPSALESGTPPKDEL